VTRFVFFETGSYDDQYRRPYTTNFNEDDLDVFKEYLNGAQNYRASAFAGHAHAFVTPQMNPESNQAVYVPGGWRTRHGRFMIEFEYETHTGGLTMREILTGYTEPDGFEDRNGQLLVSPRLVFFVNNTTTIRHRIETGVFGQQQFMAMADNSQVLVGQSAFTGQDGYANNMYRDGIRQHYMRPTDVFGSLQVAQVKGYGEFYDSRSTASASVQKSRRSNAVAAEFMGKILNSMNQGMVDEHHGGGKQPNPYQAARNHAKENAVANDTILKMFADRRGSAITNTFTWSELMELAPSAAQACVHKVSTAITKIGGLHNAGDTAPWNGVDYNTQQATILSQAIPAIMSDLLITRINFNLNNHSIGGMPVFTFSKCLTFTEVDPRPYLEIFERRLIDYVIMEMSQRNLLTYSIDASVDLFGETVLTLSIEGQPIEQFVAPTFADSLFSPVITGNQDHLDTLAGQFDNLMTAVLPDHENDGATPVQYHKPKSF
jgi:hypothetical protein